MFFFFFFFFFFKYFRSKTKVKTGINDLERGDGSFARRDEDKADVLNMSSFLPVSLLGRIHLTFLNQFGKGSVKCWKTLT